jgi:hypothetical protein
MTLAISIEPSAQKQFSRTECLGLFVSDVRHVSS